MLSSAKKMAPKRKELSTEQKNIIVDLSRKEYSGRKIAEILDLKARTVQNFLKRFKDRESIENAPRTGRPKKSSERLQRTLLRVVRENRRATLSDITTKVNNTGLLTLSSRTVRRRLFESGFKRRPVTKKITIGPRNREKRLRYCRTKLHWNVQENWSRIIFSDETKIEIGNDSKVYVWRRSDERFHSDCVGVVPNADLTVKCSAMFWGCISYFGVGTLTQVDGNINSEKYISVLDANLWPVVARHFSNLPWTLQEDNAPCHVSKRTSDWKTENQILTLPWPSQSPDLNIIENVWKVIKCRVSRRLHEIKNKQDLIRVVNEIWIGLHLHYIQSLYRSLPKRIRTVIRTRGQITKY